MELRAAYNLAHERMVRGELSEAARVAHLGVSRADAEGLGLAPFGMDLQHLHFQAHFAEGDWEHAQELADGFPVRVTSQPEAVLSSMALFVDVARGNPAADERRTWLEPFWGDAFVAYIARGLLAECALWRGDTDTALSHAQAAIDADAWPAHSPAVIRVAAVAIAARADRAVAARATGNTEAAAAEVAAAAELLEVAREGARWPKRPKAVLGREGRGWLAGPRPNTTVPAARTPRRPGRRCWPSSVRSTSTRPLGSSGGWPRRSRKRAAATRRPPCGAPRSRRPPNCARRRCAPRSTTWRAAPAWTPARSARRHGRGAGIQAGALGALTDRESEVLRLLARGLSNREIGAELFISAKTASVHVSNILGKLSAASRTEAAAIAHRENL